MKPDSRRLRRSLLSILLRIPWLNVQVLGRIFRTPYARRADPPPPPLSPLLQAGVQGYPEHHYRKFGQGPPVFLIHGWGGTGNQLSRFVDPLVAKGFSVFEVDLPAHGHSPGRTTHLLEARDAILSLARWQGSPHAVVAHSFGAAAVAQAQVNGLGAKHLVLLAPLPSLTVGIQQFSARADLPHHLVDRASRRLEKRLGVSREELELCHVAPKLSARVLLIHDEEDKTIPIYESERLQSHIENCTFLRTHGLGHSGVLTDVEVVRRSVLFLGRPEHQENYELELRLFGT